MKVLYVADQGVVGGATRSLVEMVTTMKTKYGIDCTVCTSEYNELNVELAEFGITSVVCGHRAAMDAVPEFDGRKKWRVYLGLLRRYYLSKKTALKNLENQVDVSSFSLIHTNSLRTDFGCLIAKKYKVPHIMHIREFGQEDFGCWQYSPFYTKHLNKSTDQFIAISNSIGLSWRKKGIDESKIRVIYNGVNNQQIMRASADGLTSDKTLKMVIVGGVCEAKGQLQIVEAIGKLRNETSIFLSLDIIGWGSSAYIEKIRNRAETLGISNEVRFLGSRNDVYELLKNYHVGLMCSRSEGFGRVTVEYMHAGLGVIASDTGANPEIIENDFSGLLYRSGNTNSLANCIQKYYYNREFLTRCAENGRIQANNHYTKDINASQIYSLYCTLSKK